LDHVLARLPRVAHPNLLVGFDTADDAGVYRIAPDRALVQTVDFFTPVVDDPFTFGQIAAVRAALELASRRRISDEEAIATHRAWVQAIRDAHKGFSFEVIV